MGKTFCIGDLHGGLKALQQTLGRAEVSVGDTLIFLGDYVDGWGDSANLIEYLIEIEKVYNCIFIQGNHDVWCKDWLFSGIIPVLGPNDYTWENHGGTTTINSYKESPPQDLEEHRRFFNRLHWFYEDNEGRLFVHGGYTQGGGARFENPHTNLWWDRTLFENAYNHENKFDKESKFYEESFPIELTAYDEIFVGHTSTQLCETIKPINVCNLWNLDTGAGHRYGKLTIMDVDTKEYWQSDRLVELYPDDSHNEFHKDKGKLFN